MKAAVYYENGGPEVYRYEEVGVPVCPPHSVLIKVEVIAIEGGDGIHREFTPLADKPRVGGYQCAGTIEHVGEDVQGRYVGERVVAIVSSGSHAEYAVARSDHTWHIPDDLDIELAAAVPVVWGTSHECLFEFGQLVAGQSVLIHAGAGALGLAAIQLAKQAGAKVFATASSERKLSRLSEFGVDETINYAQDDFVARIKERTQGEGVNLVVDCIGGSNLVRSLSVLTYRGRAIFVGLSGRDFERPDPLSLWENCLSIHGVFYPTLLPRDNQRAYPIVENILKDVAGGKFKVAIDSSYSLSEAIAAHTRAMSRDAFGRVLMRP